MEKTLAVSRPLTVFVLELVSSGYFGERIGPSFRQEGRAMLDAVLSDFRRIPNVTVETILDDLEELRAAFNRRADAVLCIAPEFDDLLRLFCAFLCRPWMTSLNCDAPTLDLCGDKWQFSLHLAAHGIPTPPTKRIEFPERPASFPCVVKPRFGAGSWLVRRVPDRGHWLKLSESYRTAGLQEALLQPLIQGTAVSVGALVRTGQPPVILPIAQQRLTADGEFRYLGGEIPAKLPADCEARVRQTVSSVIRSLPGLNGYIGCDLIVPDGRPRAPVIVELNPRLTTSYIGYRTLCEDNLMERLLFPDFASRPLRWKPGTVSFDADGTCRNAGG